MEVLAPIDILTVSGPIQDYIRFDWQDPEYVKVHNDQVDPMKHILGFLLSSHVSCCLTDLRHVLFENLEVLHILLKVLKLKFLDDKFDSQIILLHW